MPPSVFARRRSLPASLGRALLMAIQGVGEGVRGIEYQDEAMRRFGPDWRERLARESQLHDLSIRGKEQDIERGERQVEADKLARIASRQAIFDKALQTGALQVEGEAGRVEDLPQEQIVLPGEEGGRGYMVNLPSPATVPQQPQLPSDVRGLFPDLDDAAIARAIRGAHAGSRRQLAALQGELRRQLEGDRVTGRLQVVGAQGTEARQTEGVRQTGREKIVGIRETGKTARQGRELADRGTARQQRTLEGSMRASTSAGNQAAKERSTALATAARLRDTLKITPEDYARQFQEINARYRDRLVETERGLIDPFADNQGAAPAKIAEPQSLDEANALPDGTLFLLNGQLYRKQGANAELVQ